MARLARDLVSLLSTRDEDGYVFRVDLAPATQPGGDPGSGLATGGAELLRKARAAPGNAPAFSKARPIAGDLTLGAKFLAAIRPFIWRKHLDFAAIADIHGMKRQIDFREDASLPGGGPPGGQKLLGHDVKLGRGGIREIELSCRP